MSLKRGAFVLIDSGNKAGLYGEIEGLDEENARFETFYLFITLYSRKKIYYFSENLVRQENLQYKSSIFIEDRNKWFISESN